MSGTHAPAPKPWWQSTTIIGALVVVGAQGAKLAGLDVDAGQLTEQIIELITLLAGLAAWWGRVRATRPISRRDVLPVVRLPERLSPGLPTDPEQSAAPRRRGPFDDQH